MSGHRRANWGRLTATWLATLLVSMPMFAVAMLAENTGHPRVPPASTIMVALAWLSGAVAVFSLFCLATSLVCWALDAFVVGRAR